jgi:hypothetical protein
MSSSVYRTPRQRQVQQSQIEYRGKYYNVVVIEGKVYWRRAGWDYLDSLGENAVLRTRLPYPARTYSDHPLLKGVHPVHSDFRMCTFNACLTRMALREKQGLLNSDGQWKAMTTGDSFVSDTVRRKYVVAYILCELHQAMIMLLQEIDFETCRMLHEEGVNIVFSEEGVDSNRGGVAIATLDKDVQFVTSDAIFDSWTTNDGAIGRKHVGVSVVTIVRNATFNIACFHSDASTCATFIAEYVAKSNSIVGGDFNTSVSHLFADLSKSSPSVRRITGEDVSRHNNTIDGIFIT